MSMKGQGPRRHTKHKKIWVKLKWGIARGSIKVDDKDIQNSIADVDLCYCYSCKTFSFYDWSQMKYRDIDDEFIKERSPELYAMIK